MPSRTDRFSALSPYAPLALRLLLGAHLIHGTQDNLRSWARLLEFRDYLAHEGFPLPLASAVLSVVAQFGAGILYVLGWHVRPAAAIMLFNFTVALLAAHWGHPYSAWFPAWVMWAGSLSLLLSGAGAFSIDAKHGAQMATRAGSSDS